MRTLVNGEVHVHYGQIYVESDPKSFNPGLAEAFAGQTSGLCGAAVPGALWLTTGLHTGKVGFTVELHDEVPPLAPAWEDVVEVSFRPLSAWSALVQWAGEAVWDLGLEEIDYRVRYCARGMDQARQRDTRPHEEPQLDRYLLQFWPAPPRPDRVIRQTTAIAAHWHDYARRQPPPPTPEERAEAERRARRAQEQADRERQLALEKWEWGGKLPSEALRGVGGNVRGLLRFDATLVHALDTAGPEIQRAVALLAARRACAVAGLADLDWIAPALNALAEGRPLPPLFDDQTRVWETLRSDPRVPSRSVGRAVPPERAPFRPPAMSAAPTPTPKPQQAARQPAPAPGGLAPESLRLLTALTPRPAGPAPYVVVSAVGSPDRPERVSQPHMAVPALFGAAEADPLRAALDAVYAAVAAYGEAYPTLLEEVRSACAGSE